jgi:hypothetical protein
MEDKASRQKECSFCQKERSFRQEERSFRQEERSFRQEDGRIGRLEQAVRKTGFVCFQGLSSGQPGGASGLRGQAGRCRRAVRAARSCRRRARNRAGQAPGVDGNTPTPYRARPRDLAGSQGTVWGRDDDGAEGDPVQITDRAGAGGREFRDETPLMVAHRDRGGPWPPNVDEAHAPGACVAEPRQPAPSSRLAPWAACSVFSCAGHAQPPLHELGSLDPVSGFSPLTVVDDSLLFLARLVFLFESGSGETAAGDTAGGTCAEAGFSRGGKRQAVCAEDRLSVADAAEGFSALADGVWMLPALDTGGRWDRALKALHIADA